MNRPRRRPGSLTVADLADYSFVPWDVARKLDHIIQPCDSAVVAVWPTNNLPSRPCPDHPPTKRPFTPTRKATP